MEINLAEGPPSPEVIEKTESQTVEAETTDKQDVTDVGTEKTDEEKDETGLEDEAVAAFQTDVSIDIDPDIVQKLSEGFMNTFLPEGEKAKVTLEELLQNQKVLIETVQHEKSKFTECNAFQDLTEVMNQARQYYNKLVTVKKDMATLHDKSVKLKKRALRLQQQKQKEMLQLEQKREKELEKERALMARPAKKRSSSEHSEPKDKGGMV